MLILMTSIAAALGLIVAMSVKATPQPALKVAPGPKTGGAAPGPKTGGTSPSQLSGNNPGNLRYIPPARAWRGQTGNRNGFGTYDTLANGVRACYQQLLAYQKNGLQTVLQLITRYAPQSDNNPTAAYAEFVAGRLSRKVGDKIDVRNYRVALTAAVLRFEQGRDVVTTQEIDEWTA